MSAQQPPRLITWLIERMTSARESEIILGDMHEDYESNVQISGKAAADLKYAAGFVSLLAYRVLRRKKRPQRANQFFMINNYLKVALRQLGRQKVHHTINVVGLAIGLAASIVISLFVWQELSFDRFHAKGDRLYLLPMAWKFESNRVPGAMTTSGAGPIMKELFPEVESYTRLAPFGITLNTDRGPVEENAVFAADSTFFDLFTFPLIAGNPRQALRLPNSIVLTENSAAKYFGEDWRNKDLLSKSLNTPSGKSYIITGITENVPGESHIRFDFLISMSSLPKSETEPSWEKASLFTYVLLAPNVSAEQLVADIPSRVATKYGEEHNRYVDLDLVPMFDVYLKNQEYGGIQPSSNILYVYIFTAIAALILIIAIINYINLSTARSMERAREVGVRKVVGAVRYEIFWQFLIESLLVSLAAVVVGLVIVYFSLPLFNVIAGKELTLDFVQHPSWLVAALGTWLLISLLGGVYPALILSSFIPVKVLKGKLGTIGSGAVLRRTLVVSQFVISIFLIVCTLTIGNQLNYMVNKEIGVDKDQLISIPLDSGAQASVATLRTEFSTVAGVTRVSAVSSTPINNGRRTTVVGGDIGNQQLILYNMGADGEFVSASGLSIVAGTDLSREIRADGSWEFILNESAVAFFGWTNESAVGKRIGLWSTEGVVKGVVKDFHFLPLYRPIDPLIIHSGRGNNFGLLNRVLIRVEGGDMINVVASLEERWKKVVPGSPFAVTFLDQMYDNLYRSETRLSRVMDIFSALAILIAGLGLFGLASYTILLRTRELGIRKVLGATIPTLLLLVSSSFVRLVAIAFLIAAPVSWYVMDLWLKNFPYAVGFNWLLVIASGFVTLLVAILIVAYHALEAARVNPVNTLRAE